jgi:hypothetical protein
MMHLKPLFFSNIIAGAKRLCGDCLAFIINSDYVLDNLGRSRVPALLRTFTADYGNPAEQGDNIGLALAAGFLQHAANLHTNGIWRNAVVPGEVVHGFASGKAARDAGFGRCEIEQ